LKSLGSTQKKRAPASPASTKTASISPRKTHFKNIVTPSLVVEVVSPQRSCRCAAAGRALPVLRAQERQNECRYHKDYMTRDKEGRAEEMESISYVPFRTGIQKEKPA
jgi:hypothetical protein